jgi:hypothetical protein
MPGNRSDFGDVGVRFASALARRDYAAAYALTSTEYQRATTIEQMRIAFETIVPTDWKTVGPIQRGLTMTSWPDKGPHDVGWAYVSIGGDIYSEAVIVVVARERDSLKIRTVEWGRP